MSRRLHIAECAPFGGRAVRVNGMSLPMVNENARDVADSETQAKDVFVDRISREDSGFMGTGRPSGITCNVEIRYLSQRGRLGDVPSKSSAPHLSDLTPKFAAQGFAEMRSENRPELSSDVAVPCLKTATTTIGVTCRCVFSNLQQCCAQRPWALRPVATQRSNRVSSARVPGQGLPLSRAAMQKPVRSSVARPMWSTARPTQTAATDLNSAAIRRPVNHATIGAPCAGGLFIAVSRAPLSGARTRRDIPCSTRS